MKKINTAPISGMQELLPATQAVFNQFKTNLEHTFISHGFQNIETPIIDRTEILLAKAGGDTEKQIYKVIKTNESADDADQALRFDHTVPLARYVVEHQNDLAFPFKVTQIGRCFRGERAQKGRFREFYQCDVDIIGRGDLPIVYDAEIIATLVRGLQACKLPSLRIRVSNRKLLSGLIQGLNLDNQSERIFSIIDHAEKVAPEVTQSALTDLNIGSENVVKITTFMQINGPRTDVISRLRDFKSENAIFNQGIDELDTVLEQLERHNLRAHIVADMLIVRGLDYYTGTVFETFFDNYPQIGSVCSGGRYENLAGHYTDQPLPGVGGSIGLTRLFYVLNTNSLLQDQTKPPIDTIIIPLSPAEYAHSYELADKLRAQGKTVDVLLTDRKLGDKFNYAAKIAAHAIVVGENEVATGQYVVKDLHN